MRTLTAREVSWIVAALREKAQDDRDVARVLREECPTKEESTVADDTDMSAAAIDLLAEEIDKNGGLVLWGMKS